MNLRSRPGKNIIQRLGKVEQYKIYLAETELQRSGEHSIQTGTVNTELLWRVELEHVLLRCDQHLMVP